LRRTAESNRAGEPTGRRPDSSRERASVGFRDAPTPAPVRLYLAMVPVVVHGDGRRLKRLTSLRRSIGSPLSSQARRRRAGRVQGLSNEKGEEVTVQEMIEAHPQPTGLNRDTLLRCIDECLDCAASCTSCADACLGEEDVQELVRCISPQPRLRRRLRRYGPHPHPPDRARCRCAPRNSSLCGGLSRMWRGV
jgi:hypothetical protein